jgi:hypothetical protein
MKNSKINKVWSFFGLVVLVISAIGAFTIYNTRALNIVSFTPDTRLWWQLQGTISPNNLDNETGNKAYDIDLFDTPTSAINAIKSKNIKVICYFSAGTAENWRDDFNQFTYPQDRSNQLLPGWEGEYFVNTQSTNTRSIMAKRMDLAVSKNCDGIEVDNLDTYTYNSGLQLTKATALDYMAYLANTAHSKGLAIGLKNVPDLVYETVASKKIHEYFDFAINEQCYQYNECSNYSAFISSNKAVFIIEYTSNDTNFINVTCPKAINSNFDAYNMNLNLDGKKRIACRLFGNDKELSDIKSADINKDNIVNVSDLSILLTKWYTNDVNSDLNNDGTVNVFDLSIVLTNWTI